MGEKHVTQAIVSVLKSFSEEYKNTITFDRRKEFAGFETIEKELHCNAYFCEPTVSRKRMNENCNGLLRDFYPKGTDLLLINVRYLAYCLSLMNNRPKNICIIKSTSDFIQLFIIDVVF